MTTRLARVWVKRTLASIARIIGDPKSEAAFQEWKRRFKESQRRVGQFTDGEDHKSKEEENEVG